MRTSLIALTILGTIIAVGSATNIQQSNQSLTETDHRTEVATEIIQLKDALRKANETIGRNSHEIYEIKNSLKEEKDVHTASFKELSEAQFGNKAAAEALRAEVRQLRVALERSENATKALQTKNKQITDNVELLTSVINQDKVLNASLFKQMELQKKWSQLRQYVDEIQSNYSESVGDELNEMINSRKDFTEMLPEVFLWVVEKKKVQKLVEKYKYDVIKSNEFFYTSNGMKFKPTLQNYMGDAHIQLEFSKDSADKNNASRPFLHTRKYILLIQSNSSQKRHMQIKDRPYYGSNSTEAMTKRNFRYTRLIPENWLKARSEHLKSDQIPILIVLEPLSFLSKQIASSNGIFLWRIDNFSKLKNETNDGLYSLTSMPFKSSENGYYFDVELNFIGNWSRGYGEIPVSIRVILGENDANLPTKFKFKSTLHILDQSNSPRKVDLVKVAHDGIDAANPIAMFLNFALQRVIENPKYLKDDSILFKFVVEIL